MRPARLDESTFANLAARSGQDLISVFIPTHRKGRDNAQDTIHLKNGLAAADEELAELGWKPRQRAERLAEAIMFLDDLEFWEHQDLGLAVYVDDDGRAQPVSTGRTLDAHSVVLPVFQLRPLVADLRTTTLPVLVLSIDEVSLFVATEFAAEPVDADLPAFEDVNWFVDREKERQQHPDMVGTGRSRHGHEPAERADEDVARFLREVDSAMAQFNTESPLVVLGDDNLVARFTNQASHSIRSPDKSGISVPVTPAEVHRRVSPLLVQLKQDRVEEAKANARDRLGTGLGTTDLEDALWAARSGRVDSVILDQTAEPRWGRLDETSFHVDFHRTREPGDVDLLDRLVVWSIEQGAEVISSESDIDGTPFLAVFRY